ncbi:DNA invertase Pin-like site-specific DNA recombinase [Polymorphobacter multimanifer]|uniref:DNA invertase Pin-like site-specific DNA recombinase n=1 Tax=Polymorphobacter multimanifer TaxID=1070431 RepID=A0A841L815_9SPHN|nr:recombinase family protein [Polymorphobacter multimanifer]MBB6229149.1 DNA invertase Pin-like site-specific DNA recombinase [Polymorphobacter multimanifer]
MNGPCAQTIVCAAPKPAQQKQRVTRRTKLLPNQEHKQQKSAASARLLGYARVSKAEDQDTAPQIEALEAVGCTRVYEEHASGGRWDRPELHRLLDRLQPGDVLAVWKLDRLSRSLKDLLLILDRVEKAGAGFRSLTENIDSTTASGRMMMQMLGSFAEFERAMVRERTQAGLRSARAQGRSGGRQPKLSPQQQVEVITMLTAGRSTADIARLFRVHRATISRIVSNLAVKDTVSAP